MTWYELAWNPKAIEELYDVVPNLIGVRLAQFDYSFQTCGADLALELPAYPDHPPARWSPEANTAAVRLSFHGVDEVITRLCCSRVTEATFAVSISKRADGGVHFVAVGDQSQQLELLAEGYRIDRFSSYIVFPNE